MKTIIKFLLSDYSRASRDKREVSVLLEMGYKVVVMYPDKKMLDRQQPSGIWVKHVPAEDFSQIRLSLVRLSAILHYWWRLSLMLRAMEKECISCHDLNALIIGWMSTWFVPNKRRPKIVYDAHEFEIGRNKKRGRCKQWLVQCLEKFLIKRCEFCIMVNDSIAEAVQEAYKLNVRPIVVRNVAPLWKIDEKSCAEKRREFLEQLGADANNDILIMYHGGVIRGRGLETLLRVVQMDEHIRGIILGNGQDEYLHELKLRVRELGIKDRILFHEAVPVDILWKYVGAVDIGVTLAQNICMNHYYMLPNKIFENIQSLVPIIGSDFPEIRRIIKGYDIGLCVNPDIIEEVVAAIQCLHCDKELYMHFKNNLKSAKEKLCWENEKEILKNAYKSIFE